MSGDWGFVVWIIVIAIPVGIALATSWARSRGPGAAMLDKPGPDDPRDPI